MYMECAQSVCIFTGVGVQVCMYLYTQACRGPGLTQHIFLDYIPSCLLKQGLLFKEEVTNSG